ncbi:hypothetical protein F4776DRAFT_240850 [Hypoxylon sp. NC0597]|nr:hypothetical protein F4776DRAFT_240850 [Hypoxylon sp. NC0597]
MPSVPTTPETAPSGTSTAGRHSTMKNKYRRGHYRGKQLESLPSQHRDPSLGSGFTPPPSSPQPVCAPLRPHGRAWRERFYQHKLEQRFRNEPNGANLGLVYDYRKKMRLPYKKDRFSGAIRPRIMMDDFWDGMDDSKFRYEYRMWQIRKQQLEVKQLNDIDKEVNGVATMPEPDWASSDYEDYDSDLGFPEHKGKGSIRQLDPSQEDEELSSDVDSDKVKVKEEPRTPDQGSSPLSDLSSEISEEE